MEQKCEDFQKFLNYIEDGHALSFESKKLDSCSDQTAQAFALLLFRHASLHPDNAKKYAEFAKHRTKVFIQCLTRCFDDEYERCFTKQKSKVSDWSQINSSAAFLSELYNIDVIEPSFMNRTNEKIYISTLKNEEAIEPAVIIYVLAGAKIKEKSRKFFKTILKRVTKWSQLSKISAKYVDTVTGWIKYYSSQGSDQEILPPSTSRSQIKVEIHPVHVKDLIGVRSGDIVGPKDAANEQ